MAYLMPNFNTVVIHVIIVLPIHATSTKAISDVWQRRSQVMPLTKCYTCSAMFQNEQDVYEHLDDCVEPTVQGEDLGEEAINKQRAAEELKDAHDVMRGLDISTSSAYFVARACNPPPHVQGPARGNLS
jgi:hypothetical protein